MNPMPTTPTASDQPEQDVSSGKTLSFQQKSTVVSIFVVLTIALYYFARVWEMGQAGAVADTSAALPAGFGGLVLTTLILIVIGEAVLQAVLAFGAGDGHATTPRDKEVAQRAQRNGYFVLVGGVFLAFSSLFWNPSPFVMGNLLLLGFVVAEITRLGSQLFYYSQPSKRVYRKGN